MPPPSTVIHNPIIPGFHPDPSICRVGNDFWLVTSTFEYFPGIPVFHSRDLVNWKQVGHAIDRTTQLDLRGRPSLEGIFAPTIRYHEGVFTIITTDVGGIGNFLMQATDPAGDWSDPLPIKDGPGFTWFDPSLFFDDDGKVYYTKRDNFHIVQAEINLDTGELQTPLRKITDPFTGDDIEGPHLYRIGNYYYLLCAEGGTGWGHAITIGRSDNPWGPFEPCPDNPILTHRHLTNNTVRATGHGDLIEAPDGTWWIVFLATRHRPQNGFAFHHLGRETFLAPVSWDAGWPTINDGKPIKLETRGPSLTQCPVPERPELDLFKNPDLDPRWTWRRNPVEGATKVEPGKGLLLYGQPGTLDTLEGMAFLGQRLVAPGFMVQTRLIFAPAHDGDEAGLALYLSESFHAEIALIRRSGKRCLLIRRRAADLQSETPVLPLANESVILEITGNWDHFQLTVLAEDGSALLTESMDRRLLCTEVATGWTGLFAALYATGNGRRTDSPACFEWFLHKQLTQA